MTKKELMTALESIPDDMEVIISPDSECSAAWPIRNIKILPAMNNKQPWNLTVFHSCYGGEIERHNKAIIFPKDWGDFQKPPTLPEMTDREYNP